MRESNLVAKSVKRSVERKALMKVHWMVKRSVEWDVK